MANKAKILLDDVNECIDGSRTHMTFLKEMGYVKGQRKVKMKMTRVDDDGDDNLIVFELIDPTEPKREVAFSFLFDRSQGDGVILPFPYSKYQGLEDEERASLDDASDS